MNSDRTEGNQMAPAPASYRGRTTKLATGTLALLTVLLTAGPAYSGVIFSDSFEAGVNYSSPTPAPNPYSYGTATIEASDARTGLNSLLLDNKKGILYTLADTYQIGTYTVTYYARKETLYVANSSLLTYGYTGGHTPSLGDIFLDETSINWAYTPVTFTATIAAGSAAIGQQIQLLVEQSRLNITDPIFYKLRLDDLTIEYTAPAGGSSVPETGSLLVPGMALSFLGLVQWRRQVRRLSGACG